MKEKHFIIPIFVPHKGCPFDCIYCNQKYISGQYNEINISEIRQIVETNLSTFKGEAYTEIAFYGGSFTGIDVNEQIKYLETANEYIKSGAVNGLRLSTRPDYIDKEILLRLKYYNVKTIELGVQSLHQDVLDKSSRGHSVRDVLVACEMIKNNGFNLGIQTMIGLPGDSGDKDIYTARKVVEIAPDIVRIYPTLVIRNTYLEKMYSTGLYTPLSLAEAVDICVELVKIYERNNINVIRIGLQPTENIKEGNDVIAGPFHPAFRYLVESKIMLEEVIKVMEAKGISDKRNIVIYTHPGRISTVVGHKKENIKYLKNKYRLTNVKVSPSYDMNGKVDIVVS